MIIIGFELLVVVFIIANLIFKCLSACVGILPCRFKCSDGHFLPLLVFVAAAPFRLSGVLHLQKYTSQ
jgi:hypothetical protein